MTNTTELIKRHTQEFEEYMNKNGGYSFHRFSDGSIHHNTPIFNEASRIEDAYPTPVEPVKELEELKKITKTNDVLVTINDFVTFEGRDAILGETSIRFSGISVEIKYTGIHSLIIDYYHDLKILIAKIKSEYFGKTVSINGIRINVQDLKVKKNGVSMSFPYTDRSIYIEYGLVAFITDTQGEIIYRR